MLLGACEFRLQCFGHGCRDFRFNAEDVFKFPIVTLSPEMLVGRRLNQLNVDVDLIGGFLDTPFEYVRDSKLTSNLRQIAGPRAILLRRSVRNDFQRTYFRESGEDFILNAGCEVRVVRIAAEVLKWKDSDTFLLNCG